MKTDPTESLSDQEIRAMRHGHSLTYNERARMHYLAHPDTDCPYDWDEDHDDDEALYEDEGEEE